MIHAANPAEILSMHQGVFSVSANHLASRASQANCRPLLTSHMRKQFGHGGQQYFLHRVGERTKAGELMHRIDRQQAFSAKARATTKPPMLWPNKTMGAGCCLMVLDIGHHKAAKSSTSWDGVKRHRHASHWTSHGPHGHNQSTANPPHAMQKPRGCNGPCARPSHAPTTPGCTALLGRWASGNAPGWSPCSASR